MKISRVTEKSEIKNFITLLYTELFDKEAVPSNEVFDDICSQLQASTNNHEAYCLKEKNETVAFFTLGESFSIFAHGKYGIINELWVNENYRCQGVGKRVLEEIRLIAEKKQWHRIDVSAPPNEEWDRTFNFYQKNGFTFTGRKLKMCL